MVNHVMNHALVATDAGEDAVEQTVGGGQQDRRASPPLRSQMRVAEQPHRQGAVSMSAGASLVRACTRSSGGVTSAKCSTRPSQAAVSSGRSALSSYTPSSPGMSANAGLSVARGLPTGTVCLSSPAASGHGAWSRRRAVAGTARRPRRSRAASRSGVLCRDISGAPPRLEFDPVNPTRSRQLRRGSTSTSCPVRQVPNAAYNCLFRPPCTGGPAVRSQPGGRQIPRKQAGLEIRIVSQPGIACRLDDTAAGR